MRKRRLRLKVGDIIEIPIGGEWLAYARKFEDLSYRGYKLVATRRPAIEEIIKSGFLAILTVGECQSSTGAWYRVGSHPFAPDEDPWGPPVVYGGGRFTHRGEHRAATPEEMEQLPTDVHYGEETFVDYLRRELLGLGPLDRPPREGVADSIDPQLSVDRNDVAERVILHFEELVGDGVSPKKAIQKTIKFFEGSFDDSDSEPHIWLALAVVGLRENCLTPSVREKALDVIESGRCWWVVENVEPESQRAAALEERKEAIAKLLKQLKPE